MGEYRIQVKSWMTNYDTFMDEDSFLRKTNKCPMPMCIMYGKKINETPKMIQMELYADIREEQSTICMKCGKELKNPVSKYFGIGPECGQHNYTNPFNTKEELEKAIGTMKTKLNKIKWTGWIIKSAIISLELLSGEEDEDLIKPKEEMKVTIRIDKSNKCYSDYSLYISFPYEANIVSIIREQPDRYYNPNTKAWELPYKKLDEIKELLKDYKIEVLNPHEDSFKQDLTLKECNYMPKDYEFKIKPFKHQIEGVEYGLKYDKFLLGDEQGLGKTMQAINIAVIKKQQRNYKHCLIICGVNGLKWNWKSEVEKHSDEGAYILGTRYDSKGKEKIGSMKERLDDLRQLSKNKNYFIITNIETLRNEYIISKLQELCAKEIINMIVLDEGHKCKDPSSIQGKHLLKLQTETMISMTGTPLMNNPLDLFIHLKWLGYEKHAFYSFKNHYCIMGGYGGYQVIGYRHLDQLKEQFEDIMLRRLKKDVLDLPEKIYQDEFVEMSPKQEKIYKEVKMEVQQNIDKVTSAINPLAEMIRMRQATDYTGILSSTVLESAKLERLDELLEEIVANGNKAIIFSNWTSMTNPTFERYKNKYNPAIITGETKDRVAEEKKFMEDNSCKIIIGTTGAMGTGLTLTAATYVIFLDEPWNKAIKDQAEDRAHRIGTKENVTIITMMCKNTIDEKIHDLVLQKGKLADLIVDGALTAQNKATLVEFLLS